MKNDNRTNTVEAAEAFEKANSEPEGIDEDIEDVEEQDDDYCGCSSWDCPCPGPKRGSL